MKAKESQGDSFEAVIGLEVHAQLKTKSKIFCGCSTEFVAEENVHVCPVCAGLPGTLPVLNRRVLDYAMKMALATRCHVNKGCVFSRKNYFYPDLPKGYQISQYDQPLAEEGWVEIQTDGGQKKIRIQRIHLEEDAGKNIHGKRGSYVNLNRAGVPLIEIVSHPDLRTAREASQYLRKLRSILRYLDVSEGNMEEGNLRCDVNVSLKRPQEEKWGTRAEVKNINSFKFVEKAIEFEIQRQGAILQSGNLVIQETRLFDASRGETFSMRSKEEAHDYRYFPEPDLVPLEIAPLWIEDLRSKLPELPDEKAKRFVADYQLPPYDATLLVQEKGLAEYYEGVVHICRQPKLASNWVLTELLSVVPADQIEKSPISSSHLGELIQLISDGSISGKIAKTVFEKMLISRQSPKIIVKQEGLAQISDEGVVEASVDKVLREYPREFEKYKAGNEKLFGFFVGRVMKLTEGKANPLLVNKVLKEKLK